MKQKAALIILICSLFHTSTIFAAKKQLVLHTWIEELIEITKNTTGYSPPVAARAFAYFSIANYYITHQNDSIALINLNQLSFNKKFIYKNNDELVDNDLLVNACSYYFIMQFYKTAPIENLTRITNLYNLNKNNYCNKFQLKDVEKAAKIGNETAQLIYQLSLNDGGADAYLKNYPKDFIPPTCDSCWVRTPTTFFPSLLPYWGNNQLLLNSNNKFYDIEKPMPFSTDTNSLFYKEALNLYNLQKNKTVTTELIARYWDDAPGYSGTPTAHIFSIAKNLIIKNNTSLEQACEIYAFLGIAINDAFIVCWNLKYNYHLLRPITYIQRYIDENYNTIIVTPPFPEFPSGHSCQSGAGIGILKYYFPKAKNIVDDANSKRVDINGTSRKYKNLDEIEAEISISRWYAGIHYKNTLDKSLIIGKAISSNIIQQILLVK